MLLGLKMKELDDGQMVEVNDTVVVSTVFGYKQFKITRVTKKLAVSKRESGYEHKFKRVVSFNMSHPHQESTNSYMVLRG